MMFDVQEMLNKSRSTDTGVKLEVNERFEVIFLSYDVPYKVGIF